MFRKTLLIALTAITTSFAGAASASAAPQSQQPNQQPQAPCGQSCGTPCDPLFTYYKYSTQDRHDNYWTWYSQAANSLAGNTKNTNWCFESLGHGIYQMQQADTTRCWGWNKSRGVIEEQSCAIDPVPLYQQWAIVDLNNGTDYRYEYVSEYNNECVYDNGLQIDYSLRGCSATSTPEEFALSAWH